MPRKKSDTSTVTAQTRPALNDDQKHIFFLLAELFGTVERSLFADIMRGKLAHECKSPYLKRFGITARHFNSIRVKVEGKISSVKECQKTILQNLENRISSLEHYLKKKGSKLPPKSIHQKKRRLATLKARHSRLMQDIGSDKVSLCFGSRSLFRAQFHLKDNGYKSHEEWNQDWKAARANNIFLLGSKDETSGNQSATASIQEDGRITLRIRLPDAFREYGKYLVVKDIYFSYHHDLIISALKSESPVAISYRLVCDKKGWRVMASLPVQNPQIVTKRGLGVIGIDMNADHLAVAETDRFGNPIRHARLDLNTYGKSQNQAKALMGDVAKVVVDWAIQAQKPIAMENLCFAKKKAELREIGYPRYARMLSSFAYNGMATFVRSRATRYGVEVSEVNPAYTSVIGRVKFSKRYGLSTHGSAALCIGRRLLGCSERLPRRLDSVADGKGGYVAMLLPERNRSMHVWSLWRLVQKRLPAAFATHVRAKKIDPGG